MSLWGFWFSVACADNQGTPLAPRSTINHPANPGGMLWINLTSDEPHRARMALQMAEYAVSEKRPVLIFLNVEGVKLLYSPQEAKSFIDPQLTETPQMVLKRLIQQGVHVWVCPHCLAHAGLDPNKRLPNTPMAIPSELLRTLFESGTQTLSY
jgi:predicted peroxiredoxin